MAKDTLDKVKDLIETQVKPGIPMQQHLRAQVRNLESEVDRLQEELGGRQEFVSELESAIRAIEPFPRPKVLQYGKGTSEIVMVVKYSDWHLGELISADETEGFGAYNWKIAQERIDVISTKQLEFVQTQRAAYRIVRLVILVEGDLVSGDIHDELRVTNEFPLPVQIANGGYLLAHIVAKFAPYFDVVEVVETGGDNHGRLVKKPQSKQKAQNNAMYALYAVTNAFLQKHKNVQIIQPPGTRHVHKIAGWNVLSTHGDGVKAWMGIPFYGIARYRGRESTKRMQRMLREMKTDIGFDYMSLGHWHTPTILEDSVFINGSLSGTSEFDHEQGRHAAPSQVSFLLHPKYGYFNYTAWKTKVIK